MPGSNRSLAFYTRELEALRERHCAKVLADAQVQVREIVRPAFRDARRRAHSELGEMRRLLEKNIQAAEARLRTARLQSRHRLLAHQLRLAYEQLSQRLTDRWLDPDSRRQWVFSLLDEGVRRLPRRAWRIDYPAAWPAGEVAAARDYLGEQSIQSISFRVADDLTAGLRIRCQGVVLDGSVAGLLSDRQRIEARLLALLISDEQATDESSADSLD